MKKIIVGLISAIMMAAGLVAFSGQPAQAACPYTGCIQTFTFITAPNKVKQNKRAEICIRVGTDGNGAPEGRVTVTVVRSAGDFKFTDSAKYNDRQECFTTPKLRRLGNYVIKARFDREPGSAYKDSDNRDEFKVVRR